MQRLAAGDVGIVVANVKDVQDAKVGDTITEADRPTEDPFPGFKVVKPMVFSGVFPIEAKDYEQLRDALVKLGSTTPRSFEPETSTALGFGFRCGYLGLLHMEIVQERLEREYNLALITTAPSVVYRVTDTLGEIVEIDNPAKLHRCRGSRSSRSHTSPATSTPAPTTSARSSSSARIGAACSAIPSTSGRSGCRSPTTCRSPRWCSTSSTS